MNISCGAKGIVDYLRPNQGINDIKNVGFSSSILDFSMVCPSEEILKFSKSDSKSFDRVSCCEKVELLEEYFQKFITKCREENINFPVAIAPYIEYKKSLVDINELIEKLTIKSIEIAGKVGCKYIIVPSIFSEVEIENNCNYYLKLAKLSKMYGLMILLQNEVKDNNGHLVRGTLTDEIEVIKWVDRLNEEVGSETFGFCLNLRNAFICKQDIQNFIVTLKDRLKVILVSDTYNNEYVLPFLNSSKGVINNDWLGFIRGVREIEFDGEIILAFEDMARALSSTLRKALLTFSKSISDYLSWQINMEKTLRKYSSIVLFGAGNMCRNYIKCYGEKYPPLFTCDNNKELWGKSFYGLEIKSPLELENIPEETCIFICNTFYDEIYTQLKDMGIKNSIEFFSDEYMPSFYYDSIKR